MKTDSILSTQLLIDNNCQFLLTCCITDSSEVFLCHWRKWKKVQDFDLLDFESLILIPIFYKQVEKFNIVDENKARYKGIYKKSWVNTVQFSQDIFSTLVELKELNIPFWIVGSIAIENIYYKDCGVLRSNGVEIIINSKSIKQVLDFLIQNGYCFKDKKASNEFSVTKLSYGKQLQLVSKIGSILYISIGGFPLMLHNEDFENNQIDFNWNLYILHTLRPELEVLRLILNSFFDKSKNHLLWIISIKKILDSLNTTFDWKYFNQLAIKYEVTNIVGVRLQMLIQNNINYIPIEYKNQLLNIDSSFNLALLKFQNKHTKIEIFKFNSLIYKKMKQGTDVSWFEYLKVIFNSVSFIDILSRILKKR